MNRGILIPICIVHGTANFPIIWGLLHLGCKFGDSPSKHICDQGQDHSLPPARSLYVENDKIAPYLIYLYAQV